MVDKVLEEGKPVEILIGESFTVKGGNAPEFYYNGLGHLGRSVSFQRVTGDGLVEMTFSSFTGEARLRLPAVSGMLYIENSLRDAIRVRYEPPKQ